MSDEADNNNLIRVCTVLEVFGDTNCALVETDYYSNDSYGNTTIKKNVHERVRVLNRGSIGVKDYFNYTAGEKVVCVFPPNAERDGNGVTGFILGSFFDDNVRPPAFYDQVRILDFGDGSQIKYNLEDKELSITIKGDITITGNEIRLN